MLLASNACVLVTRSPLSRALLDEPSGQYENPWLPQGLQEEGPLLWLTELNVPEGHGTQPISSTP